MRRWPEIVLTLVLFAAVMAALSWVVNATVPGFVDWLNGALGKDGALIAIFAVIAASAVYAWRGHRNAGTRPNGR